MNEDDVLVAEVCVHNVVLTILGAGAFGSIEEFQEWFRWAETILISTEITDDEKLDAIRQSWRDQLSQSALRLLADLQ